MSTPLIIKGHHFPGGAPANLEVLSKLRWAVKNPPADPNVTFEGKTVLVTGANVGLGFEASLKYAQKGASKLILAVRSIAKGHEAKQDIIKRSNMKLTDIVVLSVDLESFSSVQDFVTNLEKETSQLDVALLNAGLANPTFVESEAGWEMAIQVNVLSTALMAIQLLPILRKTASSSQHTPHLTFVNSVGHEEVKQEWYSDKGSLLQEANEKSTFDPRKSYSMVKLLGMAAMQRIANATMGPDGNPAIIVNSCCPFQCRTNLGRNFALPMKVVMGTIQYFTARTAEEGSRTLVGATALGSESHSQFWHHDFLYPMSQIAQDSEEMAKAWLEISIALKPAQGNLEALLQAEN